LGRYDDPNRNIGCATGCATGRTPHPGRRAAGPATQKLRGIRPAWRGCDARRPDAPADLDRAHRRHHDPAVRGRRGRVRRRRRLAAAGRHLGHVPVADPCGDRGDDRGRDPDGGRPPGRDRHPGDQLDCHDQRDRRPREITRLTASGSAWNTFAARLAATPAPTRPRRRGGRGTGEYPPDRGRSGSCGRDGGTQAHGILIISWERPALPAGWGAV
jgi:hypothetical protein